MEKLARKFNITSLFKPPISYIVLLLCLTTPLITPNDYLLRVINVGLIYSVMTLGLNFSLGYSGLMLMSMAGMFGIGAYTSSLLGIKAGVIPWLGMIAGGMMSGMFAFITSRILLRLKNSYFRLATMGVQQILAVIYINWTNVTNGFDGITRIPHFSIFSLKINTETKMYYLLLIVVAILTVIAKRIESSRYGRSFKSVRMGEVTTESMGINSFERKNLAITLSGVYAGIAGSLYAHTTGFISPDVFTIALSISILLMLMIGGIGSISGCLFGSVLLSFLPELLRPLQNYYMFFYGASIILIICFMPNGTIGTLQRKYRAKYVNKADVNVVSATTE